MNLSMSLNGYHCFCKLRLNRLDPPSSCHLTECSRSPQKPQTELFQPDISLKPLARKPHPSNVLSGFTPHLIGMPNVIQHLHIHSCLSIAYSLLFVFLAVQNWEVDAVIYCYLQECIQVSEWVPFWGVVKLFDWGQWTRALCWVTGAFSTLSSQNEILQPSMQGYWIQKTDTARQIAPWMLTLDKLSAWCCVKGNGNDCLRYLLKSTWAFCLFAKDI